jgi:putative transposase
MKIPTSVLSLKGFRFPRGIIAYAVWAYHRFAISTADVEDLLAERGVIVSREAIRLWVNRFGPHFANCVRRDRPCPNDKWHLDEVVISIRGKKHWLWRAIDAEGDVLDILVQTRRNAKADERFLQWLITQYGEPRVVITDKLRSYFNAERHLHSRNDFKLNRAAALTEWRQLCSA